MLDYHDAYASDELLVTFEDCLFRVRIAILELETRRIQSHLHLCPSHLAPRIIGTLAWAPRRHL
jgi:hypothetical protein